MSNLKELCAKHINENASRFALDISTFILERDLKVLVETGAGISSLCITSAIEDTDAKLYSIDPSAWIGFELNHPNYELIKKKSIDALLPLFKKTGAWDLFISDGNHDVFCQTLEYYFAWACLREGGWLFSDDVNWGNNGAWEKFYKAKGVEPIKIGSLEGVQKVGGVTASESIYESMIAFARNEEQIYLRNGGKLTDCFKD